MPVSSTTFLSSVIILFYTIDVEGNLLLAALLSHECRVTNVR